MTTFEERIAENKIRQEEYAKIEEAEKRRTRWIHRAIFAAILLVAIGLIALILWAIFAPHLLDTYHLGGACSTDYYVALYSKYGTTYQQVRVCP